MMHRSLAVALLLFALMLDQSAITTQADPSGTTFTVNSAVDMLDAAPGDGICETSPGNGICTLRGAIQETNILPGPDTILLPAGTYAIARIGEDNDSGDFDITDDLTIIGAGAGKSVIDGRTRDLVLEIWERTVVEISGVTVTNGRNEVFGGGIFNKGDLRLRYVMVTSNTAYEVFTVAAAGGGLLNFGNAEIVGSTISNNFTEGLSFGSGVANYYNASLIITNSTIASNDVGNYAGSSSGAGGGIANEGSTRIWSSTIADNIGEGIYNSSGTIQLTNSILAENSVGNCTGSIVSNGHNLSSDTTCDFSNTGDISNTNPLLGPLQSNGGWTFTYALLEGSAAIDAGDNTTCPVSDQRGMNRPLDGDQDTIATCDIGAFESIFFTDFHYIPFVIW